MRAITALHCQKRTSLYTFGSEFRHCRNIASDVTGGIHAASENPRRIRTVMDGSGSKLQQVFSSEKLVVEQRTRTYAVQQACGCFLFVPCTYLAYFQKVYSKTGMDVHGSTGYFQKVYFYKTSISSLESPDTVQISLIG